MYKKFVVALNQRMGKEICKSVRILKAVRPVINNQWTKTENDKLSFIINLIQIDAHYVVQLINTIS